MRNLLIPQRVLGKAIELKLEPVLDLIDTQIMEAIAPVGELLQHLRYVSRQQDVTRIPAIHHALRYVDSDADHVDLFADVGVKLHWAGVNAHADAQFRMALERCGDVERTTGRR